MFSTRGEFMELGLGLADSAVELGESSVPPPDFVIQLEPRPRVFLRNLADLLWPRPPAPLRLSSKPGDFWPDVFVIRRLPWGKFGQSVAYHLGLGAAIWGLSLVWPRPLQRIAAPVFHHQDVIYYQASDYLPPLDTGNSSPAPVPKGQPAHAPQAIISVPREADNQTQTIVAPPEVKLKQEVPLPNVVAWDRAAPEVPMAATSQSLRRMPSLHPQAVAPAPDAGQLENRQVQTLQANPVGPPPVVQAADIRKLGDLNIGHVQVVAPAPQLAVPEQRTLAGMEKELGGRAANAVVPPPPSAAVAGAGGRLIALSLHPIAPRGPVEVPNGNRRGRFAATPEGKPGAPGTPGAANGSGSASAAGPGGPGNGTGTGKPASGAPSGLYVGAGPSGSAQSSVGNGGGKGNGIGGSSAAEDKPQEMAKVTPPRVTLPAKETTTANESDLDRQVFGGRKSYAMTVNIPNLNSAGGSWIIHFAELNPPARPEQSELAAPIATHEVDPGYPLELMRHNIRGTVVLRAVIRKDGSVGEVQVLRSVNDTLDQYAREAFLRWRFQPATKDGAPVALEAVVSIPFRPARRPF